MNEGVMLRQGHGQTYEEALRGNSAMEEQTAAALVRTHISIMRSRVEVRRWTRHRKEKAGGWLLCEQTAAALVCTCILPWRTAVPWRTQGRPFKGADCSCPGALLHLNNVQQSRNAEVNATHA
eukprot:1157945-Pelagomonas_calceolata.AAC.7